MSFKAGAITAELKLDTSDFKNGLKDALKGLNIFVTATSKGTKEQKEFNASIKQATKELDNLGKEEKQAAKQTDSLTSSFKSLASVFSIAALGLAVKSIFDLGAAMEQTAVSFEVLTGSKEAGDALIDTLNEFANVTPFVNDQVLKAGKALVAFGFSTDQVRKTLTMIGDVASATGKDFNELTLIYGKARTAGTIFSEDLNQLTEAGIPILDELAKVLNVSAGEIKKLASEGKIGFAQLEKAFENMTGEGGRFQDMMARQSKTAAGMLSTIQGKIQMIGIAVGTEFVNAVKPAIEAVMNSVSALTEAFSDLEDETKETIITTAKIATGLVLAAASVKGMAVAWRAVSFAATLAGISMKKAIIGTGVGAAIVGISLVLSEIITKWERYTELMTPLSDAFDDLKVSVGKMFDAFNPMDEATKSIKEGRDETKSWESIFFEFNKRIIFFVTALTGALELAVRAFRGIKDLFSLLSKGLKEFWKNDLQRLGETNKAIIASTKKTGKSIGDIQENLKTRLINITMAVLGDAKDKDKKKVKSVKKANKEIVKSNKEALDKILKAEEKLFEKAAKIWKQGVNERIKEEERFAKEQEKAFKIAAKMWLQGVNERIKEEERFAKAEEKLFEKAAKMWLQGIKERIKEEEAREKALKDVGAIAGLVMGLFFDTSKLTADGIKTLAKQIEGVLDTIGRAVDTAMTIYSNSVSMFLTEIQAKIGKMNLLADVFTHHFSAQKDKEINKLKETEEIKLQMMEETNEAIFQMEKNRLDKQIDLAENNFDAEIALLREAEAEKLAILREVDAEKLAMIDAEFARKKAILEQELQIELERIEAEKELRDLEIEQKSTDKITEDLVQLENQQNADQMGLDAEQDYQDQLAELMNGVDVQQQQVADESAQTELTLKEETDIAEAVLQTLHDKNMFNLESARDQRLLDLQIANDIKMEQARAASDARLIAAQEEKAQIEKDLSKEVAFFTWQMDLAGFRAIQRLQIAQNVIMTSAAAMAGFAAGIVIPVIGPAIAAANVTLALAAGASTHTVIASTPPPLPPAQLFFAEGGIAPANKNIVVGEKGPEIVSLGSVSRIISNDESKKLIGGGGNKYEINIHNPLGNFDEELTEQLAIQTAEKVSEIQGEIIQSRLG